MTPKLADVTDVTDEMISRALAYYNSADAKHFAKVDPRVITKALELAGGNWRRLVKESPTAVTVHNRPMW